MRFAPINQNIQKTTRQELAVQGINLSANFHDGQLSSCYGITTDSYPFIATQDEPVPITIEGIGEGYKPISIFAWEKLFVVTDEPSGNGFKCYYDGQYCGDAANKELPKQYAVVNNHLIMFPDKVYFNLYDETMTSHQLGTATRLLKANSGTIIMRKAVAE